jgi:hypothetical protein
MNISESNLRKIMKISNLPKELDNLLTESNLKEPKMCFMNCYIAVMNTLSKDEFDLQYVLGTVYTPEGDTFEHALIKWNGKYFDPTLEPQNLHHVCTYNIHKEFSSLEIVHMLKEKFEISHIKDMIFGKNPHWPLVKTQKGLYEFIDI